mmetsp:Transcript_34492/g.98526  ORF Transcript_34492/g.98526 Transcript_34492/m.98526 type:complete len:268 (+) Transcript_34492:335-1138(+)
MYSAKSAGITSLPIAAMSCCLSMPSMYSSACTHCEQTAATCRNVTYRAASAAVATASPAGIAAAASARACCRPRASSPRSRFVSAVPSRRLLATASRAGMQASTLTAAPAWALPESAAAAAAVSLRSESSSSGSTGTKTGLEDREPRSSFCEGSGCTRISCIRYALTSSAHCDTLLKCCIPASTSVFLQGVWHLGCALSTWNRGVDVSACSCLRSQLMFASKHAAGTLELGRGGDLSLVLSSTLPLRLRMESWSEGWSPTPRTAISS